MHPTSKLTASSADIPVIVPKSVHSTKSNLSGSKHHLRDDMDDPGGFATNQSRLEAAAHAFATGSYDQSAALLKAALEILPSNAGALERLEILQRLGEAEREAHNTGAARLAFLEAASIARKLDRPDLVVTAAVGLGRKSLGTGQGAADYEVISLLDEALSILGEQDSIARAQLLGRLAPELYWSDQRSRALELGKSAVEMARRVGDPSTLMYVLTRYFWMLWGPENLEQRIAAATEAARMAGDVRDWAALLRAREARASAFLEMGDIHEVDAEILAIENVARTAGPSTGIVERLRTMRALMRGEFSDAERWLVLELEIYRNLGDTTLLQTYTGQLGQLIGERGDAGQLLSSLTGTSSKIPQLPVVRMAVALLHARSGKISEARTEFDYLAVDDFGRIPADWNWIGILALLSEVCVRLKDHDRAPILHRLLSPYIGRSVTLGWGDVYYNAISHYLGMLSVLIGDLDRAQHEFESAMRFNRRMGAGPALLRTELCYAQMLLDRHAGDDNARASGLLETAGQAAAAFGMKGVLAEIEQVRTQPPPKEEASPNNKPASRCTAEGDVWTITWEGKSFRIDRMKGLTVIAYLLARPNQDVHISELAVLMEHGRELSKQETIESSTGDAGPPLDAAAKKAYKARLREAREALEEARRFNDIGLAERLSAELEFLEQELSRAIGLGGRDRRASYPLERMRVRVTNATRAAVSKIQSKDALLGAHLKTSIRTGMVCSYRPDPAVRIEWQI
jgi:tetratricopeptide (TPR) repeat protein